MVIDMKTPNSGAGMQSMAMIWGMAMPMMLMRGGMMGVDAPSYSPVNDMQMIAWGVVDHFNRPQMDEQGQPVTDDQRTFPASVGPTPAKSCCSALGGPDANNNGKCDVVPEAWQVDSWQSINYMPYQEHHHVYELVNNGKTGKDAALTIRAYTDRDCDEDQAIYEMVITVDPNNGMAIMGQAKLLNSDKEFE